MIANCFDNILHNPISLLAACPGAGKTNMAIKIVDLYRRKYPKHKILILTHGLKVLRKQFESRFAKVGVSLENVTISLPFNMQNSTGHFDFLVVDEAHHYYQGSMIQTILINYKIKKQLLLTGTPARLGHLKIPTVSISLEELIHKDILLDPNIYLEAVAIDIQMTDYNAQTREIVTLKQICPSWAGNSVAQLIKKYPTYFKKTMVIARNQKEASFIYNQIKSKYVCYLSTIDSDRDSEQTFNSFNKDGQFLIVVGRGILGFDCPALTTVIDCSLTLNSDRMFQALCRVVRKSANIKRYFKVCSQSIEHENLFFLYNVMAMGTKNGSGQNGGNSVPLPKEFAEIETRNGFAQSTTVHTFKSLSLHSVKEMSFESFLRSKTTFQLYEERLVKMHEYDCYTKWKKENATDYKWLIRTCPKRVRDHFPNAPKLIRLGQWTFEDAKAQMLQMATRGEFKHSSSGAYKFLLSLENDQGRILMDKHFGVSQNDPRKSAYDLRKRQAVKAMKEFDTRTDFKTGCNRHWNYLRRFYPNELDSFFGVHTTREPLDKLLSIASKYKKRSQLKADNSAVYYALKAYHKEVFDKLYPPETTNIKIKRKQRA